MLFSPDTELSLQALTALVNSAPDGDADADGDSLTTPTDLDLFVERWKYTGRRTRDHAELEAVRALRPVLAQLWRTDEKGAVALVNGWLREYSALPQLVKHDQWDYHLHAVPSEAPLADRMAVEAAMSMVDVLRLGAFDRLSTCAAGGCSAVIIDLSKNRSRRFCDATCANRTNVAAFRARRAARD